jgi:hypothetical protein
MGDAADDVFDAMMRDIETRADAFAFEDFIRARRAMTHPSPPTAQQMAQALQQLKGSQDKAAPQRRLTRRKR